MSVHYCNYQMEEQTVPSAGFSPQPEYMTGGGADSSSYYVNGAVHLQPPQQQQQQQQQMHHQHHQQQHHQSHHQTASPNNPTSLSGGNTTAAAAAACYDYNTSFDTFDLSLLGDSYEDRDMATVPSPSASCWSPLGAMEPTTWQQMSFYAASPSESRAFSPDCKPSVQPDYNVNQQQCNNNNNKNNNNAGAPSSPQQQQILDNSSLSNNNSNNSDDANLAHHHHHQQQQHQHNNATNTFSALRQCLEDNTFIEKYNYKPLDLPITALPSSNDAAAATANMENTSNGARVPSGATDAVGSATLDMNLEPVFSLAYETIISDIQNQCRTLGISPDPMQWSVENVHSWLSHSFTSFSSEKRSGSVDGGSSSSTAAQSILRSLWNIDGQRLCSLSEQEFHQRDPLNGEKIYANLELLKMWKCTGASSAVASVSSSSSSVMSNVAQPFDFGQLLNSCSPAASVGAASPAPSFVQDEQQSPANNTGIVVKVELDENMQPITPLSAATKFSNPSSVDTTSSSSSSSASSHRNSDDDDEEEDEDDKMSGGNSGATVAATGVAVTKTGKACGTKNGAHIHLWQFLKELLASGQQHGSCIRWLDQSRGVFKIEDSVRVARLWGIRKNRPAMNYDKLSRSIRQYYRKGIMRKTERSQRLVYQFCHPYGL